MAGKSEGFTLIETLVALTILGLSLSLLIQGFGLGANSLTQAESYARGMAIAESLLAETMSDPLLAPQTRSGKTAPNMGWTITAKPFESADGGDLPTGDFILYDVEITVEWRHAARTRKIALKTLKLAPI